MNDSLRKWYFKLVKECRRCELWKTRRNVVIGRGQVPADILFLGEAPGEMEDMLGEPFVGPSGRVLNDLLTLSGLGAYSYYVTNCVMCRPVDPEGGNREPSGSEIEDCMKHVEVIYETITPKVVVCLGAVALKYYLKRWKGVEVFHCFHPAFLLKNGEGTPSWTHNVRVFEDVVSYLKNLKREG